VTRAADSIFDAIDMDKDGMISMGEFRAAYGQMRLDGGEVGDAPLSQAEVT